MNRLDLDFAPRTARYWWARAGLALRGALVGAALALAAALWWTMAIHTERLQLQAEMARTLPAPLPSGQTEQSRQARTAKTTKGAQAEGAAQDAAMNQALLALNRPWSALWDALERVSSAPGVQVAILEMRPDAAAAGQDSGEAQGLRLLLESKDSTQMLGFMRQLRTEPMFVSAVLTSHQVNAQDPNQPLRFEVRLRWMQNSL
jgi:Tfp pilus assembly protein PilN